MSWHTSIGIKGKKTSQCYFFIIISVNQYVGQLFVGKEIQSIKFIFEHLDSFINVGAHRNNNREVHPNDILRGVCFHLTLHKLNIGYDNSTKVKCFDDNISNGNLIDLSKNTSSRHLLILNFYNITNLIVLGGKDKNTSDKIGDNLLGRKSNSYRQSSYDQSYIYSDYLKSQINTKGSHSIKNKIS